VTAIEGGILHIIILTITYTLVTNWQE